MTRERKDLGEFGEGQAVRFLKENKYRILRRNYKTLFGEIDIVARHGKFLVFIEVRTKTGRGFGSPEESITYQKKKRLRATAYHYLMEHDSLSSLWRIDFVAVELDKDGMPGRIELIENAVGDE